MVEQNQSDASQQQENQPAGNQVPASPKFELKDGAMFADGKKLVYEADLIAAKKSLEKQLETAQSVHNQAIDQAKLDLSGTQTTVAAANAKVTQLTQELEEARKSGATSEEVAKLKADLEAANGRVSTAEAAALAFRRRAMITAYNGLTEEQLKDKTSEQLDALEEALKAVAGSKGPGNYAFGGSGGGGSTMNDMERARRILDNTPYMGVRNVPANPNT